LTISSNTTQTVMVDNIIKHNTNSNGWRLYYVWWYCQPLLFVLCLMILSTMTVCIVFDDIVNHYCLCCVWWYCQPLLFVLCLMILSTITVLQTVMVDNIIKHNTNSNDWQYHQTQHKQQWMTISWNTTQTVMVNNHYCFCCVWWYCKPLLFVLCFMILLTITVCVVFHDIVNHYCLCCVWWYCQSLLFVLCLMHNTYSNGRQYHQTQHKQ
jgi:hypothetical protein